MDEVLNIEGDPGEVLAALLSGTGPDLDQNGIPDDEEQ